MINAIAELGKYKQSMNTNITGFDVWLEDSYDSGKNPHLLLIRMQKRNADGKWEYKDVVYRENSAELKSKLLYKRHAPRGPDKTPTGKIAAKLETSFQQKIAGWFRANQNKVFLNEEQRKFIHEVSNELESKFQVIVGDLFEKFVNLDKKGAVLSPVFVENQEMKFIGDFDFFARFITEESKNAYKYSKTFKSFSYSINKVCAVCRKEKEEVYGFFSALACYTVDKPGMVTGGFQQSDSWKNYPVCLECALDLEMGIKLLKSDLDFQFYGLRYYLIPKTISQSAANDIIENILEYKQSPKINDKDRARLTNAENEVFELLNQENNRVHFTLLFYQEPQKGVFRILASIEEVLPSRIKKLFDAKRIVDEICFFSGLVGDDGKALLRFNFGVLRRFFPNSKIEGNHDKAFLELTQKIFSNSRVDYPFIIRSISEQLRTLFVQGQPFQYRALQGFMLINFMNILNIFRNRSKEAKMEKTFFDSFRIESKEEFEPKAALFFDEFSDFFCTDAHCAIFLLGILAQLLLNIQLHERQATPFRSRLKGLKMDARDVSCLLPEIIEKLDQYKANYYWPLEKATAKYLVSAGASGSWRLAVDEINFIFALGMTLSTYFKIHSEKDISDKKEAAK
jgi:CRISPR-associated protein Csh1